jgi:hypothetical protein
VLEIFSLWFDVVCPFFLLEVSIFSTLAGSEFLSFFAHCLHPGAPITKAAARVAPRVMFLRLFRLFEEF